MDGAATAAAAPNRPPQPAPQQQASLIRPEQVARLPQLSQQQKQQYEAGVRKFWEVLNSTPQADAKYNEAYQRLVQTSSQLMQGMKNWQQAAKQRAAAAAAAQQQQVAAQAQQAGANVTNPGGNSSVQFNQLNPEVQRKVNEHHFYFPPGMMEGTKPAEEWLREAKARFGQALQRLQVARQKKAEFQRQVQQRQQAKNPLSQQETEVFNNKMQQCDKAIAESTSFMKKFNEQQEQFQRSQPQHQFTKQAAPGTGDGPDQAAVQNMPAGLPAPTAHSISSAVSAARNQANAAAGSPQTASVQPGANAANAGAATPVSMGPGPFHQQGPADPASVGARPVSHQGSSIPAQALQNPAQAAAIHAHPLNSSINGQKASAPVITKNLQVTEPKPVVMPPSRPTLNGGAGVGLPGQLAQPAITSLPGYVLESSEDGRLLSKKKLNELVREVCGSGGDEQLTPEAEEVRFPILSGGLIPSISITSSDENDRLN